GCCSTGGSVGCDCSWKMLSGHASIQRSLYVLIIYVQLELRVSWSCSSLRSCLLCLFRRLCDRRPTSSEEERKSYGYCYAYDGRDCDLESSRYDHDVQRCGNYWCSIFGGEE